MGKHAYLIMAHNQFGLLKKLIKELDYEHNDISFNQIGLTAKEKAVKINKEFTKSMKKELPDKDKKDAVDLVKQLSEDKNIRKKLLMKLLEIESGE